MATTKTRGPVPSSKGYTEPQVVYIIDPAEARETDTDMLLSYIDIANGIILDAVCGDYRQGNRNTMMLDLAVSTYMMDVDTNDVLDELVNAAVILHSMDDEDPYERVRRALDYSDRFGWDYMIDPDWYELRGDSVAFDRLPVMFRLKHQD